MLQIQNVLFKRGQRVLFDTINVTVYPGHKVGIVGRNGAGKSTLFELIRGRILPEEGDVLMPKGWRLAWLEQSVAPSQRNAIEFVMDGDRRLRGVEAAIADTDPEAEPEKLATLYSDLEDAGGYDAESRAGEILYGLGFGADDFDKPHREFSGGWRIRLNLARALMTPSDLLLLDEPTNHLDMDATIWLERWLGRYEGTMLTIAHDRDFLDKTVGEIVHIDDGNTERYVGNYASFERQRAESLERQASLHRKQSLERARIQAFVDRFRAKASKARQVQSRLKALDRMSEIAQVHAQSPYRFTFSSPDKTSNPLISIDDGRLGYGNEIVLDDLTLRVYPHDRIGILGVNGAGKTTLLRTIAGDLDPVGGSLVRGQHSSIGYFAQHQLELLKSADSPMAHLLALETMREQTARDYLGGWGFSGDDVTRPVANFSGGEKARLVLALIARQKPAVLLLDEPTNHLDIQMREALAVALQEYEGALLLVSHDRHLLRNTVDDFWIVKGGGVSRFDDDIDAYAELISRDMDGQGQSRPKTARERRQDKARARESLKPLKQRQTKIERAIADLQPKLDKLAAVLASPDTYGSQSTAKLKALAEEHGQMKKRIASLEQEWLDVAEQLEAAEHG